MTDAPGLGAPTIRTLTTEEDLMSVVYHVILTGDQEAIPTGSTAKGVGVVVFDSAAVAATYSFDIEGLDFGPITTQQTPTDPNDVTNAHFHAQVRGVSGGVVFGQITPNHDPDDVQFVHNADDSWSVSGRWETTDGNPITNFNAVLGDTFANVLGSAAAGSEIPLYFNVHAVSHTGGEIRGQLVAIADDIDSVKAGTTGGDVIKGGHFNDALVGLAGNDTLSSSNGDDVVDGGAGNDVVNGGNGNDLLYGSTGNDTLDGSNGDDTMEGGSGNDVLNAGTGNDTMNGGDGNDSLTGSHGNDTMNGGAGDDSLDGGTGNDTMNGGAGNDSLNGGIGNDTMNGGDGNDVLTGGFGADLFVFNVGFGDDVIAHFDSSDRIQFDDELFASPAAALLAAQQVGNDIVITSGTDSVTLLGVKLSSLQAADFSIVV
jgi:Ca2+-binding RTX toxin-like protein